MDQRARHSRCSRNPFRAGHGFRGYSGSQLLRPVRLLAPQYGPDRSPANGGFYFQAFSGSVALPAAGYDYNSVWTPLLAGLSPAGMAASLAAQIQRARPLGGLEQAVATSRASSLPESLRSAPRRGSSLSAASKLPSTKRRLGR